MLILWYIVIYMYMYEHDTHISISSQTLFLSAQVKSHQKRFYLLHGVSDCIHKFMSFYYTVYLIYFSIFQPQDLSYSGHLLFTYHNGYHILSERIKLTSMTSAIDIIPTLLRTFLPQYDANESNASNNYIILSQGGSESVK